MSEENSSEVEARKGGWVPQDQYRGKPEEWVTAEEFVERGQKINPILRANNERLKKEIALRDAQHEKELQELRTGVEEFKAFQKETLGRKVQEYEKQIRELRKEKSEATTQENHERVAEIEEQIDRIKDDKAEATAKAKEAPKQDALPPKKPDPDVHLQAWLDENPWYGDTDNYEVESDIATQIGATLKRKNPNLQGVEFLNRLDEELERRLPEVKGGSKRATVESGSRSSRPAAKGKHSYENLPADAKANCDRFVKDKLLTREQYLEDYDWS